jgi:crossover junction endodeoxyribonuclease RuvC
MVILGIDPGLATLGWGVITHNQHKQTLVKYGCIITPPDQPFPMRLLSIRTELEEIIADYSPDEIAFEELFFARNVTTALTVGAARGVCVAVAARHTNQLYEYTPMQVKQALTGYGRADKKQIQEMVKLLLTLPEIPKPDDAADALAVALTHAAMGAARSQFIMK